MVQINVINIVMEMKAGIVVTLKKMKMVINGDQISDQWMFKREDEEEDENGDKW